MSLCEFRFFHWQSRIGLVAPSPTRDGMSCRAVRVRCTVEQVAVVGDLPHGLRKKLGMVQSQCLSVGLHGVAGASVSLTSSRSATATTVWSHRMLLASSLLDWPRSDHLVWARLCHAAQVSVAWSEG